MKFGSWKRRRGSRRAFGPAVAAALVAILFSSASAGAYQGTQQSTASATAPFSGTLYFTTYQNQGYGQYGTPNVFTRSWSYDGSGNLTLGTYTPTVVASQTTVSGTVYGWAYGNPLATEKGADGILFGPSGNLLVAGQEASEIYSINPHTGTTLSAGPADKNAYHMAVDPKGTMVWTFGQQGDYPGQPASVPLPVRTTGKPTLWIVTTQGSTAAYGLTQIAFVPGPTALDPSTLLYEGKYDIFYTASPDQGGGDFGYLIPPAAGSTTFTAVPLMTSQPWTHGLVWDVFSQTLIATGSDQVAQINPQQPLSSLVTYTMPVGSNGTPELDQVATDGAGHLFVADNHGDIYFMDYAASKSVGIPTFVAHQFLANTLDDATVVLASTCAVTSSGGGSSGDSDQQGDVSSNDHNGKGEDNGQGADKGSWGGQGSSGNQGSRGNQNGQGMGTQSSSNCCPTADNSRMSWGSQNGQGNNQGSAGNQGSYGTKRGDSNGGQTFTGCCASTTDSTRGSSGSQGSWGNQNGQGMGTQSSSNCCPTADNSRMSSGTMSGQGNSQGTKSGDEHSGQMSGGHCAPTNSDHGSSGSQGSSGYSNGQGNSQGSSGNQGSYGN